MTKHVFVDDHSAEVIEQQVKLGHFANEAEVVRSAIELLLEQDRFIEANAEAIREALAEADAEDEGEDIPAAEVFAELRARYRTMAEERGE